MVASPTNYCLTDWSMVGLAALDPPYMCYPAHIIIPDESAGSGSPETFLGHLPRYCRPWAASVPLPEPNNSPESGMAETGRLWL
jgi:hypothetical protein